MFVSRTRGLSPSRRAALGSWDSGDYSAGNSREGARAGIWEASELLVLELVAAGAVCRDGRAWDLRGPRTQASSDPMADSFGRPLRAGGDAAHRALPAAA